MANVIKHKRGSGSDPVASDLVVGEVAIRTDVGKLFTKMDNGSVAEIAGGGSDIAINTLSSSSATGGGSATFNGSAYRFTLSAPPSVSAQQLLVSINGVIQKPVAGTGQPSEGFSVDGTDIILGDAPATGSDFFILTFKSLGVSEPADNSVTSAKIVDGAIVNADINASAAIAGTKISPNFGSQNLVTDGTGSFSFIQINAIEAKLTFNNLYSESDFSIRNNNGDLQIIDIDNSDRVGFQFGKNGTVTIPQNTDFGAGIDVTGAITGTGDLTIDTNTLHVDSSNNRVGIGTTSPSSLLNLDGGSSNAFVEVDGTGRYRGFEIHEGGSRKAYFHHDLTGNLAILNTVENVLAFHIGDTENMRLSNVGLGIGTTSPDELLHIKDTATNCRLKIENTNNTVAGVIFKNSVQEYAIQSNVNNLIVYDTTDSATRIQIDTDGRVQIGSTNNSATGTKFVVGSGNNMAATALINTQDTDIKALQLSNWDGNTTTHKVMIGFDNSGHGAFDIGMPAQSADFAFQASGGERMRITGAGNVGIGTTSPTGKFAVSDGTTEGEINPSGGICYIGTRSNHPVTLLTNATGRMTIDTSGDVGIGNDSPSCKLAIKDVAEHTAYASVTPSVTESMLQLYNNPPNETANDHATIQFGVNGGSHNRVNAISAVAESAGNRKLAFTFCTDEAGSRTEKMRITGDGNIGIGTTSPDSKLHVSGISGTAQLRLTRSNSADNTNDYGRVLWESQDDVLTGQISVARQTAENDGFMTFKTASSGTLTERMRIDKSGNIGAPNGTNIHNASDIRLKKNVITLDKGLEIVKNLRPVSFNWIDGFCDDEKETLYGFIAQEVETVDNNLIQKFSNNSVVVGETTIDNTLRVKEKQIIPILVKALQEAIGRIEALEAK